MFFSSSHGKQSDRVGTSETGEGETSSEDEDKKPKPFMSQTLSGRTPKPPER
jgi:hypothetical protein